MEKCPSGTFEVRGREDAKKFVAEEQAYDAAHKIRMAPPPRELTIPEHLILVYAKRNFRGARGAQRSPGRCTK